MMPTFEASEIADMKLDFVPPADPLNANPAPVRMELGKFAIAPKAWLGFIPTSLEFTLDGFKMAVDPNDPKMAQLAAFGITDIDLSSKIDYAWDEAANRLNVNDLSSIGTASASSAAGTARRCHQRCLLGRSAGTTGGDGRSADQEA